MINQEDFKIIGDWSVQSKQLLLAHSKLSKADLEFKIGGETELLNRISDRLRIDTNAAKRIIIENFLKSFDAPDY